MCCCPGSGDMGEACIATTRCNISGASPDDTLSELPMRFGVPDPFGHRPPAELVQSSRDAAR